MPIKAIIFDLDGTIAEFNLDYKAVRAEVMQLLSNRSIPISLLSVKESVFEMLKRAQVHLTNIGKEEEFAEIREDVLARVGKHEFEAARQTSLLPGVCETLRSLKSEGKLKLGIFTINSRKSTDYILNHFRLRRFFDVVITRETVSNVKPDPEHLAAALEALGVNSDEVVVVGDSITDMVSAKALNIVAVGLVRDSMKAKALKGVGAKYTIHSITDLASLISRF